MSYTILTSRLRWALWNNLLRINVYLGLWVVGRNDPKLGADRPRSWGGSTGTLQSNSIPIAYYRVLLFMQCRHDVNGVSAWWDDCDMRLAWRTGDIRPL